MYGAGFAALALARLATVVAVAASNRDTLPWDPTMLRLLAVAAAVPVVYLFHSIQRYFTFRRALGIDHFDPSYRSRPLVRQGIFRYTRNAMYVFGFLMAWIPGLWFGSAAGLVVALFSHAYIWVHYIATERPDMRRIYSQSA
jgi:protein-S-isoprenylcysteine O-methyltransferase Ste14